MIRAASCPQLMEPVPWHGVGGGVQGPWWSLVWPPSRALVGGTRVVIQTLPSLSLTETRECAGLGPPRACSVFSWEDAPVRRWVGSVWDLPF